MARVTVEDCVEKIPNRFELIHVAAQRSREISNGARLTVDRDNDKNPVVALRELADGTVSIDDLKENLIRGQQQIIPMDHDEDEIIDFMEGESDWENFAVDADADSEAFLERDDMQELGEVLKPAARASSSSEDNEFMIGQAIVTEDSDDESSDDDNDLIG